MTEYYNLIPKLLFLNLQFDGSEKNQTFLLPKVLYSKLEQPASDNGTKLV